MKSIIGVSSEKGLRDSQQDRCACLNTCEVTILGVADGNGGNGGGEIAEYALKSAISHVCWQLSQNNKIYSMQDLKNLGLGAVNVAAKETLQFKSACCKEWQTAGTTVTLVIVTDWIIGVFWIGDSPAYLLSEGEIKALITPHTLLEYLVKQGIPRETLAGQEKVESMLERCVGFEKDQPDSLVMSYQGAITAVVGSDGVFNYLLKEDVKKILAGVGNLTVRDISQQLVQEAKNKGSDDNLTVVVSRVVPEQKQTRIPERMTRFYEDPAPAA